MSTPLNSNDASSLFNDTYDKAKQARRMAEYLGRFPSDGQTAQQWHLIADSLFEAVELFDKMATRSNGR